jgi:DNA-binding Lrp family transcriptional regulator
MISACILVRSEKGKFDDVVATLKQIREAKRVFPVLGRFDAVVDLEVPDYKELGPAIMKMAKMAGVIFTESLVEIQF